MGIQDIISKSAKTVLESVAKNGEDYKGLQDGAG